MLICKIAVNSRPGRIPVPSATRTHSASTFGPAWCAPSPVHADFG